MGNMSTDVRPIPDNGLFASTAQHSSLCAYVYTVTGDEPFRAVSNGLLASKVH